jgi:hypothetical protein
MLFHDIARLLKKNSLCQQTAMHHVNIPRITEIKQKKIIKKLEQITLFSLECLVSLGED